MARSATPTRRDLVDRNATFLGRGWSFPPDFRSDGTVATVAGEEDIRQSLFILFSTIQGERLMVPDYGCSLFPDVFEIINATTLTQIGELIGKAILYHEPRIAVDDIAFFTDRAVEGLLEAQVAYTIKATNSRNNIVYPFYLTEGNNVRVI